MMQTQPKSSSGRYSERTSGLVNILRRSRREGRGSWAKSEQLIGPRARGASSMTSIRLRRTGTERPVRSVDSDDPFAHSYDSGRSSAASVRLTKTDSYLVL